MKYFAEEESAGMVYTLDYFEDEINENLKRIRLLGMKRDYGGEMWCKEDNEFVEKGFCGYGCRNYNPCNGKKGRCRHLVNGFIETGEKFILTELGLEEDI